MAQILLTEITLDRDYGLTPIDNTDFSDLTNWTFENPSFVTINTQASNNLDFDSVSLPSFGVPLVILKSPVIGPVTIASGTEFDIDFTITSGAGYSLYIQFYSDGYPVTTAYPPSPFFVDTNGAVTITVTCPFSFDQVVISILNTVAVENFTFSDMTIAPTNSSVYDAFDNGDRIFVYWDNVANDFFVQRQDNPAGTLTTITDGPILTIPDPRNQLTHVNVPRDNYFQNYWLVEYNFCDGTDLNYFRTSNYFPDIDLYGVGETYTFPYVVKYITLNSAQCNVNIVCDVFIPSVSITPATNRFIADGSVQLYATSSHSSVRFKKGYLYTGPSGTESYTDLTSTEQLSGLFENLRSGTYHFVAVDIYNCIASIDIIVPSEASETYGAKYQLQYYDVQSGEQTVIQILERAFTGTSSDVVGGADPLILSKPNGDLNNKFDILRSSSAVFNIISRKHFQYIGLYSQDDRKYKLSFTHDTTSWKGFLIPSVYSESYSPSVNYQVSITAVDNLANLSQYDFLDESENPILESRSLLSIVTLILNKLDLEFNITSCINKFSDEMDTGIDPLVQTYIECLAFYDDELNPMHCDEVLQAILKPFGAIVIQQDSEWRIIESDAQTAAYAYRRFDPDGSLLGSGTIDPLVDVVTPEDVSPALDGVLFANADHNLDIIPAYGKMSIKQNLKARSSIWPLSMQEWQTSSTDGQGYGTLYDIEGSKKKGLRFLALDFPEDGSSARVNSTLFTFTTQNDSIKLSFKYLINLYDPGDSIIINGFNLPDPAWIRIDWSLVLIVGSSTFVYNRIIGWESIVGGHPINSIFVDKFTDDFDSFDSTIELPSFTTPTEVSLQLRLSFYGSYYRDFDTETELRAIVSADYPVGYRVKGLNPGDYNLIWFDLIEGTDADSSPDIIRPNDYNASTNAVVWKRYTGNTSYDQAINYVRKIKNIDLQDVVCQVYPGKKKPIESVTTSFINNPNYKENIEIPLYAGDLPTSILSKELYTNIFTLEDGTPTKNWKRSLITELAPLQSILLKSYANQYTKPTWRLSGSWLGPDIKLTSILKVNTPGVSYSLTNPNDPGGSGWTASGSGQAWTHGTGESTVVFDVSHTGNSLYLSQSASNLFSGQRVRVDFYLTRSATIGSRIDRFVCVLFSGGLIVQSVLLADGIEFDEVIDRGVNFNIDQDADTIGFFIQNITGDGDSATYSIDTFDLNGVASVRYYYANQMDRSDRGNMYRCELVQLIPAIVSTDPFIDDTGGGDTGGSEDGNGGGNNGGSSFSGAYSNGYGSGFDTNEN